jgi:ribonuclease BN (tRNA processing enzyme)
MRPATPLSPVAGPPPDFRVVEIDEGATTTIGDVRVTAASNSHYALWQGTPAPISLSFRFDLPDRSIAYTGDTGPSVNVERLAQGVDLLVSNVADPDTALDRVKRDHPAMPAGAIESLRAHFTRELLTSDEIGLLAKRARVRSVVLTHFAGVTSEPDQISRLTLAVSKRFHGPIFVANDLDRF